MKDLRPIYFNQAKERLVGNRLAVYNALNLINCTGTATGTELAARMGWPVTSIRPRLCELRELRWVETTGVRRDGEHEFRALDAAEVAAIIRAENESAVVDHFCAAMERKQMELI
jgi:hypothetical protein